MNIKVKLSLLVMLIFSLSSCNELTDSLYEDNVLTYDLHTVSTEYGYTGEVIFKEFSNGKGVEVTIQLYGDASEDEYYFPAHLHFGAYEAGVDAGMASMLNGVDIRPLRSVTVLEGYSLSELMQDDYHIKVHLASSGPEYNVILVAGNVGKAAGQ
ncbi:hypothetical protein [Echinicola vietnamensis]|uniref:CHRD domain-containing protein n=1 Tax=Echinicola vietnamensis (strain DSM 17526 / LMG 23754 / KMM 6221) TaxID=926556 RepID=L0FZA2_ECHVK|nr:hypothetical protein [Echinicola vietnamensis]AGA79259.1 hypothetical protein Echvi_3021 [Echinicola vietnamensis DSM 17526]